MGYEHTKPTMKFHYQNIDQSLEMAATVFFFFFLIMLTGETTSHFLMLFLLMAPKMWLHFINSTNLLWEQGSDGCLLYDYTILIVAS